MPEDRPQSPPPPPPIPPQATGFAGQSYATGFYPNPAMQGYPAQPYPRPAYAGFPGYPLAPPTRRSPWFWVAVIVGTVGAVVLLASAMIWSAMRNFGGTTTAAFGVNSIAVLDIDGVILDADKVDTQLRKFGDDSSIKAIILHINSPGGGAAASQEIYHEVLRVRQEKHKKIVASVESVGASGAYYIASACDRIYANDASVVGSIGVIMEWTNYGDLMRWAKLKSVIIHAGELKDAGDPSREMTPKEQAYFQSLVDNMYSQFVHDVATGRHTTDDKIRPLATGQVWTGQQSVSLGLIDKIGGYRIALMDTARDVGISGEPNVVRPASARKGLAALLSGDADSLFPNPGNVLNQAPGFYFMWR